MMLLAIDQSVRGFAWASVPLAWENWAQVNTGRLDGGKLPRGATEAQLGARQDKLIDFAKLPIIHHRVGLVGFESYAYSARPNVEVVELVGALKRWLRDVGVTYETIQQSSWRARLGKIKRGEEKETVKAFLTGAGAPPDLYEDEYDALGILNQMLALHGGRPLV